MPLIYDIKNKKAVRIDADTTYDLLEMQGSGYMPMPNWKYTVQNPETGEMEEVVGDKVRQRLRSGFILHDTQAQRMRNLVRSQGSALGEFSKSFLNEALLGIPGYMGKKQPKNEVERMYDEYYQKEFKTSRTLGSASGLLLPYLGGGILGASAKTASKGVSKLLKALPSAKALRTIDKLGTKSAKVARKTAQNLGIKNKTALNMIGGAGRATGWAVGDTALFATKRGIEGGFNRQGSEPYDRSFHIKSALSEAKGATKEIFSSSFLLGGSLLFAGGAIGATARKVGALAGKAGRFTANSVREADLAHLFRREFFNNPSSQKAMELTKKRFSYSHRFLKTYISPKEQKQLFNKIPEATRKAHNIKEQDLSNIVRNISEKDFVNISTRILKDFNGGKLPRTRKEVHQIMTNMQQEHGFKLGEGREAILKKHGKVVKNLKEQKEKFMDRKRLQRALFLSMPNIFKKNLNDIHTMKMKPKSFWTKRKLSKSKLYKDPSLDDNMRAFYTDVVRLPKSKFSAKDIKDPKVQVERFMDWVVYHSAPVPKINSVSDMIQAKRQGELFKHWRSLGLSEKALPIIQKRLQVMMDQNPTAFQEYFDFSKMNTLFNASGMSFNDLSRLKSISSRYIYPNTKLSGDLQKVVNELSDTFDDFLPKGLFVPAKEASSVVSRAKKVLSEYAEIGKGKKFKKKSDEMLGILERKKRLSIFDINELMRLSSDLGDFLKIQPDISTTAFRKLYSRFSALEDTLLKSAEAGKFIDKKVLDSVIESKGKYSLSKLFLDIFDKPVRDLGSGGKLNFRDLFFAAGGGVGGGAALIAGNPVLALGALTLAWGAAKGVSMGMSRGAYFLHMADKIDNFSLYVKRQNKVYSRFKDHNKLSSFVKGAKRMPEVNFNLATLSYLFFNQPSDTFEDFYDKLQSADQVDLFSNTQGEVVSILENIGGAEASAEANKGIVDLKQMVMSNLPKGQLNPVTGKRHFSNFEKDKFFLSIRRVTDPATFLNSFREGNLSRRQSMMFSRLFPSHYNSLVISTMTAMREKGIDWPLPAYNSANILTHNNRKAWIYHYDMLKKEKQQEEAEKQRSGGIKFSQVNQPLQSQRVSGGQI